MNWSDSAGSRLIRDVFRENLLVQGLREWAEFDLYGVEFATRAAKTSIRKPAQFSCDLSP
jgi:hypothetical protein